MNISSFVNQITQTITDATNGNNGNLSPSALEESIRNGLEAILSKGSGQSVTGEVLQMNGNEILLSLGENQLLQARLEGGAMPRTGQLMTFQIQNMAGNKILLTPLFENLNQNSNISTALKAAGLPLTDQMIRMVKDMMQEGLPIDRQSLYQMNRAMNLNQGVPTATLAQMQRLGIPLEADMIRQFQNYQNYEHQITGSLSDLTDAFTESFLQLSGEQGAQEGLSFVKDVLGQFVSEEGIPEGDGSRNPEVVQNQTDGQAAGLQKNFTESALYKELKEIGASPEQLSNLVPNKGNGQQVLKEVLQLIDQNLKGEAGTPDFSEKLGKFLEGKEFKQLFKETLNRQLLLEPAEVAQEGRVDQLYEKLNQQMKSLNALLSDPARGDTALAKTVTNLNQNMDFMNAVNQNFSYIQIPLKMYNKETSGELFVYTNKKSLAKKDGNVSALLHLDMEYLGSVDVYVTLSQGQKVATKFYLQDDAALDLIAEHIDLLNDRLSKRGYSMNAEFINRDTQTNVLGEILDQSKNISVLSGTSFDVRA